MRFNFYRNQLKLKETFMKSQISNLQGYSHLRFSVILNVIAQLKLRIYLPKQRARQQSKKISLPQNSQKTF